MMAERDQGNKVILDQGSKTEHQKSQMGCAILYHLYNLKNVKNTRGVVLLFVKLQA